MVARGGLTVVSEKVKVEHCTCKSFIHFLQHKKLVNLSGYYIKMQISLKRKYKTATLYSCNYTYSLSSLLSKDYR